MLKQTILVTGGCRSGKIRHALSLADAFPGRKLLVSANPLQHEVRNGLGEEWFVAEEANDPVPILRRHRDPSLIVLDRLPDWVAHHLHSGRDCSFVRQRLGALKAECCSLSCSIIVITSEVGAGIVPNTRLGRDFRDLTGRANQSFASSFDRVVQLVSGIPVTIKGCSQQNAAHPHEFSSERRQGVYDAVYKRRDVRHFNSRPVDPVVLRRVLDAAHHAGSVGFMQPWNFLIVHDQAVKEKVAANFEKASGRAAQKFSEERRALYKTLKLEGIVDSPINICVTCDSTRLGPQVLGRDTIKETDLFSTCCAIQNLWLAARSEGLAVGWVSILSQEQLKKDLAIPDHIFPVAYLCVGHTDEFKDRPMLESSGWAGRLPLDSLIYYNRWEGRADRFSVQVPEASRS